LLSSQATRSYHVFVFVAFVSGVAVRADEANHRDVNHVFSQMHRDQDAPFTADNKVPKTILPADGQNTA
jgi:hypothetical protein